MILGIVIVNYRTADLTCECLRSLERDIDTDCCFVVVVDNNSADGSVEKISQLVNEQDWRHWVHVLPLNRNGGFAHGNNTALQSLYSSDDIPNYVWLLNPDTIVKEGACTQLLNFLRVNPAAGIVGSRLEDPDGTPQISAFRHHSIVSELLAGMCLGVLDKWCAKWVVAPSPVSEISQTAEWVAGASMMIRKEVFESIGFLDDKYFLYFEEEDFCKQAYDAGWACWYVPASRVVHLVGAASGISDTRKKAPRRPAYWFESRRRFFLKNYGWATLLLADSVRLLGYSLWRIRRRLQNKPDMDPPYFLRDLFSHSVFCKGFHL